MKKVVFSLMLLIALAGCGSSLHWEAKLTTPSAFQEGKTLPLSLSVTEGGKPASSLLITAVLEMSRMEHDTVEVRFTEVGDGRYEAAAELPMGGEWVANLHLERQDKRQDIRATFNVKAEADSRAFDRGRELAQSTQTRTERSETPKPDNELEMFHL